MKKLLTLSLIALFAFVAAETNAQIFRVGNSSMCTVNIYAAAEDASCNVYVTNINTVAGGGTLHLNMADPSIWSGGIVPPPGSTWSIARIIAPTGPYVDGFSGCTSPVSNGNFMHIGSSCAVALPTTSCMKHSSCGVLVNSQWIPTFPHVTVLIN